MTIERCAFAQEVVIVQRQLSFVILTVEGESSFLKNFLQLVQVLDERTTQLNGSRFV
jgi:hypothetical protein